jgi:hypothetical protein
MLLNEFVDLLSQYPDQQTVFVFPDRRTAVPPHFHLTEVASVTRKSVDCGGTNHSFNFCHLQLWVSDDVNHRLDNQKFSSIIQNAIDNGQFEDKAVPIVVEWDVGTTALFSINSVDPTANGLVVFLMPKNTDCLAKEKCCAPKEVVSEVVSSVTEKTMDRPDDPKSCCKGKCKKS